jgi:predicted lipase
MEINNETLVECFGACFETIGHYDSNIGNKTNFSVDNVQGIIGYMDRTMVIVFRGSDEFKDWVFNFTTAKQYVPYGNYESFVRVHKGWSELYKETVRNHLHYLVKDRKPKNIIVTGHSLGGALATLCSVDLQYNFPSIEIACVTFGSPKVGNKSFIESFNKRVPDTYRYVYGRDWAPLFPFVSGYEHVSFIRKHGPKRRKFFIPSIIHHIITLKRVNDFKKYLEV